MRPDNTNGEPDRPDIAAGRPERDRVSDGHVLRDIAEKLESRGLSASVIILSGEKPGDELIEEIKVVNPAARERGVIRIGDDGAVTWELFGELSEAGVSRILDEATNALRATGLVFRRATRPRGDLNGSPEQRLIYLNTHWGRSYSFAAPAGPEETWKAKARFGNLDEFGDSSAGGLLAKVHAHYQAGSPGAL